MNIIETLIKLRDDIKTWVTNNLNALKAEIDEKTIPVDDKLSSTSTNPVQNKVVNEKIDALNDLVGDTPVATQISTAIASQKTFSGDYNDLTNAPNIAEDGSGNVTIADEAGNIIFRVDEDGAHTTDVNVNGISLEAKIPVWDAKSDFSGDYNDLNNAPDIVEDGSQDLVITDNSGNIIFKVDADGVHTTALTLNGTDVKETLNTKATQSDLNDVSADVSALQDLVGDAKVSTQISEAIANQEHFSGDYNDLINAPDIQEDGAGNMIIADESGNIIFQADAGGINTTSVRIANQDVLTIMDDKIASLVDSSPETLDTLNELAAALGDDPNFAATVAAQIGGKVDKVDGMGLSETNFTFGEKTKLDTIEEGANKTIVDSALSNSSENPVQNKAVYAKLDELTGMESVSSQVNRAIGNITHPVISVNGHTGAVVLQYEDIENAPNIYEDSSNELVIADPDGNIIFRSDGSGFETTTLTAQTINVGASRITGVDPELSTESTNPVQNKVVTEAINNLDLSINDVKDYVDEKFNEAKTDASNKDIAVLYEAQAGIDAALAEAKEDASNKVAVVLAEVQKIVPAVTAADNGKFLRVVDGVWAATTVNNAEGVSF